VVERVGVIGIVEDALPLAEVAQHLRRRLALLTTPAVNVVGVVVGVVVVVGSRQHELLVLEQQHAHHSDVHRITDAGVPIDQRNLRPEKGPLVSLLKCLNELEQFHKLHE